MKNITLMFLCSLYFQWGKAQESSPPSIPTNFKTISLSAHWNFLNSRPFPLQFGNIKSTNFRGLGFSFSDYKIEKRKYKNISTLIFLNKMAEGDQDIKLNALSISFGLGRYLYLFDEKMFRFKYGGGLSANYYFRESNAKIPTVFDNTVHSANLSLSFESQLDFQVMKQIYFFLGLNLKLTSFGLETSYTDNPNLLERQKKNGGFYFTVREDSFFRIGMGWTLE